MLDEARAIAEGRNPNAAEKDPKYGGVSYSKPKRFDYDGDKLRELVQNARLRNELAKKVESGIERLIAASYSAQRL